MAMVDLCVKGAGIFGLSIAYACAERGARVTVEDPGGVGAGSSGGIVGALAPHVPENWNAKKAFQLESLLMAESFWSEVRDRGGQDPGYARLGRIQPLADDRAIALAQRRAENAKALWQGRADWRVVSAPPPDWRLASPTGRYVCDDLSARIHPRQACDSLAAALRAMGVTIETQDSAKAQNTVWATGWHGLLALSKHFDRPVGNGVKGQALAFAFDVRHAPQVFADGLHIIPHADGTVAVGSTSERDFDDHTSTDDQLNALAVKAQHLLPDLASAPIVTRWAGVRPRAKTRAPVLGAWPDRPGHFIANGGFKIGFGMAPKVAEVMADLLLEGKDQIPEGFRVNDL